MYAHTEGRYVSWANYEMLSSYMPEQYSKEIIKFFKFFIWIQLQFPEFSEHVDYWHSIQDISVPEDFFQIQ